MGKARMARGRASTLIGSVATCAVISILVLARARAAIPVPASGAATIQRKQEALIQGSSWLSIGPAMISNGQAWSDNPFAWGGRTATSGRATAIAVNPFNTGEIWVGSASGGAWRFVKNEGIQWQDMTAGLNVPSLAIGDIKLDQCSALRCNRIWVGTGENAIRRDTYYGAGILRGTFTSPEIPALVWERFDNQGRFNYGTINNLLLDPVTEYVWVALSRGVTSNSTHSTLPAPEPSDGVGVYRSTNQGEDLSWTKLAIVDSAGARPTDLEIDPVSSNVVYAAFAGKGIYRTDNAHDPTLTWQAKNTDLPPDVLAGSDWIEIGIAPSMPGTIYAFISRCPSPFNDTPAACAPGVYRSQNRGDTWEQRRAPVYDLESFDGDDLGGYAMYTHALAIDPLHENNLFWGGGAIATSPDGGSTWGLLGNFTIHPDHHEIIFPTPPYETNTLMGVNDGGFFASANSGASWEPFNLGLNTVQVQSIAVAPKSGFVIAGTQDNGVNLFTGSNVWDHIGDSDASSTIIDADSESLAYYVTFKSRLKRCTTLANCGYDWPSATSGLDSTDDLAWYPPLAQDPSPLAGEKQHALYFGTERLYRSTDDALSWTAMSPKLGLVIVQTPEGPKPITFPEVGGIRNVITAIGISKTNASQIYIGYYDGQIWYTNNGSDSSPTWSASTGEPGRVVTSIMPDPTETGVAYATFSGFGNAHVFRTGNGGVSWEAIDTGLPAPPNDLPANALAISQGDAQSGVPKRLWLGTDLGIFRRPADLSTEWERFSDGMPNVPVYALTVDEDPPGPGLPPRNRIFAGTHGRGVFVITEPFVTTEEGWVDGGIWDIPVYGHGFPPQSSCTVTLLRTDGTTCATGTTDGRQNAIVTNTLGELVAQGATAQETPVWGCFNGACVGNNDITNCLSPPVSTVLVTCGGVVGNHTIGGCPALENPPSGALSVEPPPSPPPSGASSAAETASTLGAFQVFATLQAGNAGGTKVFCGATVEMNAGDSPQDIVQRAADTLASTPECSMNGVTPIVRDPAMAAEKEDPPSHRPSLAFSVPGAVGTELFAAVGAAPGQATGACFGFDQIGVKTASALVITKLTINVAAIGAHGGEIVVGERSGNGMCSVGVMTTPGQTAEQIAQALFAAFNAPAQSSTGLAVGPAPQCFAAQNPHDVTLVGDSLIFVVPRELVLCIRDAGVGFDVGPEELTLNAPPVCGAAIAAPDTLVARNKDFVAVDIVGVTDPDGDPVTISITDVLQDEPAPGPGATHAPDAIVSNGSTPILQLRSERLGSGDGRVYHVFFTATDSSGFSCSGSLQVCVPHDQARGTCVDGGPLYSSFEQ